MAPLVEIVRLDGYRGDLADAELDRAIRNSDRWCSGGPAEEKTSPLASSSRVPKTRVFDTASSGRLPKTQVFDTRAVGSAWTSVPSAASLPQRSC